MSFRNFGWLESDSESESESESDESDDDDDAFLASVFGCASAAARAELGGGARELFLG